jgi:hypothetical protein
MRRLVLIALAGVLVPAGIAQAATPLGGASYGQHQHNTGGHDWHVQFEVGRQRDKLKTLVVYSQRCHETGFTQRVEIGGDGSFAVDRATPDGKGRWKVDAVFTDKSHATGTWEVTRGDCTDGREFDAKTGQRLILGNEREFPPARRITYGSGAAAHHLRHVKNQALAIAPRFGTVARARAHGYVLDKYTSKKCPGFSHARKNGTGMWGNVLDPEAPQALVFWCDSDHHFSLAAFMFRAPVRPRPNTFNDLMQWHRHGVTPNYLWMSHLWLVRDPVSAWSNCAPFNAFTEEGLFEYEKPAFYAAHSDACSDTEGIDE